VSILLALEQQDWPKQALATSRMPEPCLGL
jgi:hypothetical protein